MATAAAQQTQVTTTVPWVNWLQAWILEHPAYQQCSLNRQKVLQTIANACDKRRLPDGSLVGAYGGPDLEKSAGFAHSTFWTHLHALERLGFVVLLTRGGMIGNRRCPSTYGIPGQPGCLNHVRARHEARRWVRDPDGANRRLEVIERGEQPTFWARGSLDQPPGSSVRSPDTVRPEPGQCLVSPPLVNGNTKSGVRTRTRSGGKSRRPCWHGVLSMADLKDTGRLLELFELAVTECVIDGSDHSRIWFVGAAEHALEHATTNPPGLFVRTVHARADREGWVTAGEYEEGARRIRIHLYGR